jgi:glyoxylase-like metal-dependent hydrolase (beta-lactamase superfamily II)
LSPLRAEEPPRAFQVTPLADGLYELSIDGGGYPVKVLASVGTDGVLLVDTGDEDSVDALSRAVAAFGRGLPRIIVSTHSHVEHLGGNAALGKEAVIIAHRNMRERFDIGLYAFLDLPREALPDVTFTDSLTLHFNGEEIRLIAFPGAHDDSDIVVWFTRSKVAYTGALCMGGHFPSVDGESGDIRRYPEVAARVLDLLPEDVRLVPGHADDCTHAQGRAFQRMLAETGAIVRREMAAGRDMAAIQSANALADFASYESSYVKCDTMIQFWFLALREERPDTTGKVRPYGQIHAALKEKGIDAAVAVYQDLKTRQADQYLFEARTPMFVGRILAFKGDDAAAARFLKLCIAESPASDAACRSHGALGRLCAKAGDREAAVRHFQAYLEGYPNDAGARKQLQELQEQPKPTP